MKFCLLLCLQRFFLILTQRPKNVTRRISLQFPESSYPIVTYLFQTGDEALLVKSLEPVPADVQVHQVEAGLRVVVTHLLDEVGPHVEPQQGLGDEAIVEPLQPVVRHIEPLEVMLNSQESVDVLQTIIVKSQSLEKRRTR